MSGPKQVVVCLLKEVQITFHVYIHVYLQIDRSTADRSQDSYETCRSNDRLFGEQRTTMAAKFACLNMCVMMVVGGITCI